MTVFSAGTVHELPEDIIELLTNKSDVAGLWESLTPLARNEWICWVESVKKLETRQSHLKRMEEQLKKGKKRPCCWPGCPHR
ncbi:YdeI/OmpD-associated family protein [Myxococcota bacterium]|nr:YdeI/OmpD-associated family protein [Myxococcota bacterium]MBU1382066.1 YdeI/OmpD-associated family protein [Myxococcota bacterium]MBU1495568.1 YdeI/OmpD-associated family protein [Myxococcota bacterium]